MAYLLTILPPTLKDELTQFSKNALLAANDKKDAKGEYLRRVEKMRELLSTN